MVLVFTSEANASSEVLKEVTLAGKYHKAILPFRIEAVEPSGDMEYHLSTPHWLDALTPPMEAHIRRLVESVARILGREVPAPVAEPVRVEPPELPKPVARPEPEPLAATVQAPAASTVRVGPNYAVWGILGGLALVCWLMVAAASKKTVDPPVASPSGVQTKIGKYGLRYVRIPAGQFEMGCSPGDKECESDESPRHTVRISQDFWLGQTEVTVAAFQAFAEANGVAVPDAQRSGDVPVVSVTWEEAAKFCRDSGGRLPTEAQWEYAARAGSTSARYGDLDEIAWTLSNSGYTVHEVGKKAANTFSLYDMIGNVWEWNADWYDGKYYSSSPSTDPTGAASGSYRSARGGSWGFGPSDARASYRFKNVPTLRLYDFGFRCTGE